jgi:hypothetical protein
MDRKDKLQARQPGKHIQQRIAQSTAVDFFNLLTGPELLECLEAHLPEHRERRYPPTQTLSMFMKQVLSADRSCQHAVNSWALQCAAEGLTVGSVRTGGYCQARQRLPQQMVSSLARQMGDRLSKRALKPWRWCGRTVKLVDGTSILMSDTLQNQQRYPQPSSQTKGVGFPIARVVGVICLSSGAVLDAAIDCFEGTGHSEHSLMRSLLGGFAAGDVLLADALYCNYYLLAMLQQGGVDVLMEQNGTRRTDFRRGLALGPSDHRVCWDKPDRAPPWMSAEQYAQLPAQISVRELEVDGRILVTTLLEPSKQELAHLYSQRWHVELDFRNIKTTLDMEMLRCMSPQMVEKEFWVYLLAYNSIRVLMAQAACEAGVLPREISFKHTVQLWTHWVSHPQLHGDTAILMRLIATYRVGRRAGRREPRARKRRPKHYPRLTVPRAKARQRIRQHAYPLRA